MLEDDTSLLMTRLCGWYAFQCNGDWEHQAGIKISTLDNPGWSLKINLTGTNCHGRTLDRIVEERTKHDWVVIWTETEDDSNMYHSAGGPSNLPEMILRFLEWAASNNTQA